MGKVLIIGEQRNGELKTSVAELVSAARSLAFKSDDAFTAPVRGADVRQRCGGLLKGKAAHGQSRQLSIGK